MFFVVSDNFLGPYAASFARRLTCPGGATLTYLPAMHFTSMRKYIQYLPHILSVATFACCIFLMSHIPFLLDGRYTGMTMLLIPLHVLFVIGLHRRTPALGITKVTLECATKIWVDDTTDRCRACQKSIALSGKTKKRNFMDHVLRHVSLTVCGLCYLTGCTEHVARHCMRLHGQKNLPVPNALLGRFVVHPDLLEPFIAFA